jgi:hypothetical protein
VVDLFKLYTFNFGHMFIRAIVWKETLLYSELLEILQIYEHVLIFFLLLLPSLFLCSTAHRQTPAFSPATSCPFAALPAPLGPQLTCPPLNRARWLLLVHTLRAACRPSRHARRQPPAVACRSPTRLFLVQGRAQ